MQQLLRTVTLLTVGALLSLAATQKINEIRLAASPAVRGAIGEIGQAFESETGVHVNVEYDVFAAIKRRIDAGEQFDVVVLSPELVSDLVAARTLAPGTVSLGRQGVGLAARAGVPLPDIRTTAALMRALLGAESIGYFREGTAGVHFLNVVERLGISSQLRGVLRDYDTAELERAVLAGDVQYVVAGNATLRALAGVGDVAPLPDDLQSYTSYTAGAFAAAKDPTTTTLFLKYLASPPARKTFVSKGLDPVEP